MQIWDVLQDILELSEKEKFWETGDSFGYELPDGHYLLIYLYEDAETHHQEIHIRPYLTLNGVHVPCGDCGICGLEDTARFLIEVAWVIETQCENKDKNFTA